MPRPVTLALAGDAMLGRLVNEAIAAYGYTYPWGNLVPVLQQADLFLVNLECALTSETRPWHDGEYKAFYFRADPSAVEALKVGRVDFACLANNHACDFGTQGLLETIQVLDEAGIAHAGAGENLAAARAPARLTADGYRIAVVAFADYPAVWAATTDKPGISYVPVSLASESFAAVESAIASARSQADLVIYTMHWGPNMRARPTKLFQEFAHRVITAGADIFWGHSAHLVQGVEVYRDRLILYDTGDLIDDYAVDPVDRNDLSALFLVRIVPPDVQSLKLLPVTIGHMQVNLAGGKERDWFLRRIARLCEELGTRLEIQPETGLACWTPRSDRQGAKV